MNQTRTTTMVHTTKINISNKLQGPPTASRNSLLLDFCGKAWASFPQKTAANCLLVVSGRQKKKQSNLTSGQIGIIFHQPLIDHVEIRGFPRNSFWGPFRSFREVAVIWPNPLVCWLHLKNLGTMEWEVPLRGSKIRNNIKHGIHKGFILAQFHSESKILVDITPLEQPLPCGRPLTNHLIILQVISYCNYWPTGNRDNLRIASMGSYWRLPCWDLICSCQNGDMVILQILDG